MAQFFTKEFFEDLASRLNADDEWKKKTSDLTTRLVATCTDRDISVMIDIQNGVVATREVAQDEPADFKFEGSYEAWLKSAKGEADLQTLVMTGKMRFKGSMSKIMALMSPLSRLTAVLRDMPKEF
ncbi:MAG: SCP2 sterol-binding domain-containing protein [Thermoplasmata archaeon]